MSDNKKRKDFYRMSFGALKLGFLILIAVLSFAGIIIEALFIAGVITSGGNLALYGASLGCLCLVFLVDMYVLIGSSYVFKDKYRFLA